MAFIIVTGYLICIMVFESRVEYITAIRVCVCVCVCVCEIYIYIYIYIYMCVCVCVCVCVYMGNISLFVIGESH